jgi:hypothetical protein
VLSGRSAAFTQDLEIKPPTSGSVKIEAFVTDVGGNLTRVVATA